MNYSKPLIMGANGFLGSHIAKQLAPICSDVHAFVRPSSDVRTLEGTNAKLVKGDIHDKDSLRQAMQGRDVVFYCIVDTRAWLKDTSPLYRTNVEGLRNVLDVAVEVGVQRFIFTSSIVTIGLNESGIATEEDTFNWHDIAPEYVRCRVQAEDMLFDYHRKHALPAIAMCVANTYGPGDVQPTPHGGLIRDVAFEKMSLPIDCENPVVDIRDAATAMLLAAKKGQPGERYIVASDYPNQVELFRYAAAVAGVKPPRLKMSIRTIYLLAVVVQTILKLFGKRISLNTESVLLSHVFNEMHGEKAKQQLGWQPRPIKESIRDAVHFYLAQRERLSQRKNS